MATKESVVVALFDVESEAYQAFTELKNAAIMPAYTVSEAGIVVKRDGEVKLRDKFTAGPDAVDDTLYGAGMGTLVGVLGSPMGMLLGGSMGALAGSAVDGVDAARNSSVIGITAGKLYDGETAIVALVQEEDEMPLDSIFGKYSGQVMRHDAAIVEEEVQELMQVQKDAETKARAALKQEKSAERKAKIEGRRQALKDKFASLKK